MPRLYVQQSMFESYSPTACIGELTLGLVDGTLSVGGSVRNLVTLEPLALSCTPGLVGIDARQEAHEWLDELLEVLAEVSHQPFPD